MLQYSVSTYANGKNKLEYKESLKGGGKLLSMYSQEFEQDLSCCAVFKSIAYI